MHTTRRIRPLVAIAVVGLVSVGCSSDKAADKAQSPAKVEAVAGSDVKSVTLTEDAAKRIALTTAPVRDGPSGGAPGGKVIPYAAVLYDAKGATWTYTNPQALVFVRQKITVDRISGEDAILTDGPGAGVAVVTVGAAELYGAESGIGK